MLNKSYKYGIRVVTLTGYEVDKEKGRVFLHTNEKDNHWDRPFDAISSFLKELEPTDQPPPTNDASTNQLMSSSASAVDMLKGVLMDNIEKLQKDPNYIKQAQAITNNVNSLINLTKLQLDFHKASKKQQG